LFGCFFRRVFRCVLGIRRTLAPLTTLVTALTTASALMAALTATSAF
jgi:hypothetical protein